MDQVQTNTNVMAMPLEEMLEEAEPIPADKYDTLAGLRHERTVTKRERLVRRIQDELKDYNGSKLLFIDPTTKGDEESTVTQFYNVLHTFGNAAPMTSMDFSNTLWGMLIDNIDDDNMFLPTAGETVLNTIVHSGMFSTIKGREIVYKVCDRFEKGIPKAAWKHKYNSLDGAQQLQVDAVVRTLLSWARDSNVSIDPSTHLLTVSTNALKLLEPGAYTASVLARQAASMRRRMAERSDKPKRPKK